MKTQMRFGYGRQHIDENDIEAVVEALRAELITTGPLVSKFESDLGDYFGCKHVTVCNSGTSALYIASMALGVGPGGVVIVPSQTFLATASVPHLLGAEVVFCDVDPDNGLVTEDRLLIALQKCKTLFPQKRLQAIYVVHMNGHPANVAELSVLAKAHDTYLIEDACHAIGGSVGRKDGCDFYKVGSCRWSDAATFSFHPVKNLTTGEGGAAVFRDADLNIKAKLARNHGISNSKTIDNYPGALPQGQWSHFMETPSLNFRLPDILCALGISQLKKLDNWRERRAEIYDLYAERLRGLTNITPITIEKWAKPAWHLMAMHVDFAEIKKTRYEVFSQLKKSGITAQVHYQPVHLQPYWVKRYGMFDLPGASKYFNSIMSLPLFIGLRDADVEYVIENFIHCVGTNN